MAWSEVASATLVVNGGAVGGTHLVIGDLGAALTADDVMFASIALANGSSTLRTVTGITDSLGNTWTKHDFQTWSDGTFRVEHSW